MLRRLTQIFSSLALLRGILALEIAAITLSPLGRYRFFPLVPVAGPYAIEEEEEG